MASNPYLSGNHATVGHRMPFPTAHIVYLILQIINEYDLPVGSSRQQTEKNTRIWRKKHDQNPEMREDYRELFQKYTIIGVYELAARIQNVLKGKSGPLKKGFLGLPVNDYDFEDLSHQNVASLEAILEYVE